jgi:threonine/homoserine/homoserine lactone efflux protein
VLCVIGFFALWKRKRTLLAFVLFLIGFALTQFIQLFGFAYIFFGGFLLLRAWRLNKYGTTDSKVIRREAAARPRGRQRKEAATTTSKTKTASAPGARKPPTASKRYTPKAPQRKKIPKPTE